MIWRYLVPAVIVALALVDLLLVSNEKGAGRVLNFLNTYFGPYVLMTIGFCVWFLDDELFHGVPYFLLAAGEWLLLNRKRQRILHRAATE